MLTNVKENGKVGLQYVELSSLHKVFSLFTVILLIEFPYMTRPLITSCKASCTCFIFLLKADNGHLVSCYTFCIYVSGQSANP